MGLNSVRVWRIFSPGPLCTRCSSLMLVYKQLMISVNNMSVDQLVELQHSGWGSVTLSRISPVSSQHVAHNLNASRESRTLPEQHTNTHTQLCYCVSLTDHFLFLFLAENIPPSRPAFKKQDPQQEACIFPTINWFSHPPMYTSLSIM